MALKDIENKILSDAELEAERLTSNANSKADEIIKSAKEEAASYVSDRLKEAEVIAKKETMQAVSLARLSGRDSLVFLKRQFINDVYKTSLGELGKLSKNVYESIIEKIMAQVGKLPSAVSVIVPKGKEKQTEDAVNKASAKLKLSSDLKFTKQTFDGVGGFILDAKDMRIDGTFEHYLDGLKDELEYKIVETLFGGGK